MFGPQSCILILNTICTTYEDCVKSWTDLFTAQYEYNPGMVSNIHVAEQQSKLWCAPVNLS
jgi:hypothetical protein